MPTETDLRAAIVELADAARPITLDGLAGATGSRSRRTRALVAVAGAVAVVAVVAVLVATLTGRRSTSQPGSAACPGPGRLTPRECAIALRIAHHQAVLADLHHVKLEDGWPANIRIVTARAHHGTSVSHNAGPPCRSGQLLTIELIGRFTHIVISPMPGEKHTFVHGVTILADAVTGRACLTGAQTGQVAVPPGATVLFRR